MRKIFFVVTGFVLLAAILAGVLLLKDRTISKSPVNLVNQNSKVVVSINSNEKIAKILADHFPAQNLTLTITDQEFETGKNDYWQELDGSTTFFGGYQVNMDPTNPSINLSILVDTVNNAGWDEQGIAKYLEYTLYSSIFNAIAPLNPNKNREPVYSDGKISLDSNSNIDEQIQSYQSGLNNSFPDNLFFVSYVE